MKRAIKILTMAVIIAGAFVVGLYMGLNDKPNTVKGVYSINYNKDIGKVMILTKIDFIEQEGDKLIINGTPTVNTID